MGKHPNLRISAIGIGALLAFTFLYSSSSLPLEDSRRKSFLACLKERSNDENICLEKLGYQAWYPREEPDCMAVAERIDAVLAVGGLPRWPDLFRNERCARLSMPHHEDAAAAGDRSYVDSLYLSCYNADYNHLVCGDIHGRHKRYPRNADDCDAIGSMLSRGLGVTQWETIFENERCWRLGLPHFKPD